MSKIHNWEWTEDSGIEDAIVQYCRKAFGKRYKNMWIEPIYFSDKYCRYSTSFFEEVGVNLYPKLTDIRKEFQKRGISAPKPIKNCKNEEERELVREQWNDYRSLVWEIVQDDIDANVEKKSKACKGGCIWSSFSWKRSKIS